MNIVWSLSEGISPHVRPTQPVVIVKISRRDELLHIAAAALEREWKPVPGLREYVLDLRKKADKIT